MNYPDFVRSRFKSGEAIAKEMTPQKAVLLSLSCLCLVQESDRLDTVKKYAIYNKDAYGVSTHPFNTEAFKDFKPTPAQCQLLHAAIGLAGEAGELLDTVRKHVFDGQPLDRDNVKEEAGDIIFYLEALIQTMQTTVHEIITGNMEKLTKRYESGYSDKAAQERADKAGAE
jgi:NTP pyrophosphatase (non-canonical NTP hydrolase)